jgi:hypothetical protein
MDRAEDSARSADCREVRLHTNIAMLGNVVEYERRLRHAAPTVIFLDVAGC